MSPLAADMYIIVPVLSTTPPYRVILVQLDRGAVPFLDRMGWWRMAEKTTADDKQDFHTHTLVHIQHSYLAYRDSFPPDARRAVPVALLLLQR